MKGISKVHLLLLIIVWVIVHLTLFYHYGIRSLLDSTEYLKRADFIIAHHTLEDVRHIFYAIPISLMTIFRWLFPDQIIFYLIFQCLISGLGLLALYRASSCIFNSRLAGLLSALIFLFWWDNIHWNITIMSESLFCSFTCFIIFQLAHFNNTAKDYFWITVLSIAILFLRPTGVVVALGVVAFLLSYYWPKYKRVWKISILLILLAAGYIGANVMFKNWDFTDQHQKGNIVTYMDSMKGKPLYSKSLIVKNNNVKLADSNTQPVLKIVLFIFYNPLYFLKTASLKIWYLVSAVRPYYSLVHNVFTFTWMAIIYTLYCFGWKQTSNASIKLFSISVILVNCCLIAIATVDWDNRFYIPMEPGIVLLAGGGAAYVATSIKNRLFPYMTTQPD